METQWLQVIESLTLSEEAATGGLSQRESVVFLRDSLAVLSEVYRGIPIQVLEQALVRGLIKPNEIHLVLSVRTYRRRKKGRERLSVRESDKFVRLLQITELAAETLDSPAKARRWLRQPKRRFGGKRPIDMLETGVGAQAVETMLIQLAHGLGA